MTAYLYFHGGDGKINGTNAVRVTSAMGVYYNPSAFIMTHADPAYEFVGDWYYGTETDSEYTLKASLVDGTVRVAASGVIHYWPRWTNDEFVVVFEPNGGTGSMANLPMRANHTNHLPACSFSRSNHRFLGWSLREALQSVDYTNRSEVVFGHDRNAGAHGNVTLSAVWGKQFTLKFNRNRGGGTMPNIVLDDGETRKLPACTFTAPSGYKFDGWSSSEIGGYQDEDEVTYSSSSWKGTVATLDAKWVLMSYKVHFEANADGVTGSMKDQTLEFDVTASLSPCAFSRVGYRFNGWATSPTGSAVYANLAEVKNLSENDQSVVNLYATWVPNVYYVRFNANAGGVSGSMKDQTVDYDVVAPLSPCAFSRVGYRFDGWASSPTGSVVYADAVDVKNLSAKNKATVDLYALWAPNPYYVRFDGNGGTGGMDVMSCEYGRSYALPANAYSVEGSTFSGWATNAAEEVAYGDRETVSNLCSVAGATNVLKAVWRKNAYRIAFDANGGVGSVATLACEYDAVYQLPTNDFARTGFTFSGWATNSTDAAVYAEGASVSNLTGVAGGEVMMFATWSPKSYTVVFDANGGQGEMSSQAFSYGVEGLLAGNAFTNRGCRFTGWSTEAYGLVRYADGASVSNLVSVAHGECRLFAQWETVTNDIMYALDNGTLFSAVDSPADTYVAAIEEASAVNGNCVRIDSVVNGSLIETNKCNDGFRIFPDATGELTFRWKVFNFAKNEFHRDGWKAEVILEGSTATTNLVLGYRKSDYSDPDDWADYTVSVTNVPMSLQFRFACESQNYTTNMYALFDHVRWVPDEPPPVPSLYTVEYDVNGGDIAATPLPSYLEVAVAESKTTLPVLNDSDRDGGWMFAGWSADPLAKTAEFPGGASYQDLAALQGQTNRLHAVWQERLETEDRYEPSSAGYDARGTRWIYRSFGDSSFIVSAVFKDSAPEILEIPTALGGLPVGGMKAIPGVKALRFIGDRPGWRIENPEKMSLSFIEYPAVNDTWKAGPLAGYEDVVCRGYVGPVAVLGAAKCYFWTNANQKIVFAYAEDDLPAEVIVPETVTWGGVVWTVSGFERECFAGQKTTSIRYPQSWTERMLGVDPTTIADGITSAAPAGDYHTVTFAGGNGAVGSLPDYRVPSGYALKLPSNPYTRVGYVFAGWRTESGGVVADPVVVNADMTLAAGWSPIQYAITYILNGGKNAAANPSSYTIESSLALSAPSRDGHVFKGWTPNDGVIAKGSTGAKTFTANWTAVTPDPPADPEPTDPEPTDPEPTDPEPTDPIKPEIRLFDTVEIGGLPSKAMTYYGFLGDTNELEGTFTLALRVPRNGVSAATMTLLDPDTGKKTKIKGSVNVQSGVCTGDLAGLELGLQGVTGSFRGSEAQGAVDAVKAKDAEAQEVLAAFKGHVYTLVCTDSSGNDCQVTATVQTKGKVKISGRVGTAKVSGTAQMSVGDRCAVPFVYRRNGVGLTFVLWFDKDTRELLDVTGLGSGVDVMVAGESFVPASGDYVFSIVEPQQLLKLVPDAIAETPTDVVVTWNGSKYDAGKAASVKYDRRAGKVVINTTRGTNISGLTLKYSRGSLSGSFTVYGFNGSKLVKNKFTVAGVVVDGVGYASATNRKLGSLKVELVR